MGKATLFGGKPPYSEVSVRGLIDDTIGPQYRSQASIQHDRHTRKDESVAEPPPALLNLTILNKIDTTAVADQSHKQQTFRIILFRTSSSLWLNSQLQVN